MQIQCVSAVAIGLAALLPGQALKIFSDPKKACSLLESEGIAAREWTPLPHGYQCIEVPEPSRAGESPAVWTPQVARGRIEYQASGSRSHRITRLKLLVHLKGGAGDEALLNEYERLAAVMLDRIGLGMPQELRDAIRSRRPFRQAQRGANITFDPGRRPYMLLALIVRDPGVRVVPIPRAASPNQQR